MESIVTEENAPTEVVETEDILKNTDSAENFQKFVYELFEKNGVLNDLRAYLRGHIVNVLKSAQKGDPPACQKHFTQRLDLTYQALNILIAEYLLRLEFSYSLSVFVSEIPLANMVFGFAKTLMRNGEDYDGLKFKENDVWSILNYLGVKCDSDHTSYIMDMYKSEENLPLLLCILKCMPMYSEPYVTDNVNSSEESVLSSVRSFDTINDKNTRSSHKNHGKCKHYTLCQMCQSKLLRVKEKYRKKKKNLTKNMNETNLNPLKVESLMKNISVMERSLIDEMFEQVKNVYEAEVDMIKEVEQREVKRSVASHTLLLKKRREEMELSFKAREEELERNVQQKKKFLWGVARALRRQQSQLAAAMTGLEADTTRLAAQENSLKSQLAEGEKTLRQKGEEIRSQISNELVILDRHLESMKRERDSIRRERSDLENLKTVSYSTSKIINVPNLDGEDIKNHYDLLRNELSILKRYLESIKLQPKCVIERSTLTELHGVTSKLNVVLNNGQDAESSEVDDDKLKSTQLINDLKKQKNVNFSQWNLDEIYRERSRDRSRSSASSEAGDAGPPAAGGGSGGSDPELRRLRDENYRLQAFARQQRSQIEELVSQQARLQAGGWGPRPRSAPRPAPHPTVAAPMRLQRIMDSASSSVQRGGVGGCAGGGEQRGECGGGRPRELLPGDTIPFIGVIRDPHTGNRRHLINQWRTLRRRPSPSPSPPAPRGGDAPPAFVVRQRPASAGPAFNVPSTPHVQAPLSPNRDNSQVPQSEHVSHQASREPLHHHPRTAVHLECIKNREKSPKSVLREAKENLRTREDIKHNQPTTSREKSPNSVLREAKLRLRKLEIEAEAVEKSYLDFRKRQSQIKDVQNDYCPSRDENVTRDIMTRDLDLKRSQSLQNVDDEYQKEINSKYQDLEKSTKSDFNKYLCEYQTKYDLETTYFSNRNKASAKIKPIPNAYSDVERNDKRNDYLETPLTEFRKLYNSGHTKPLDTEANTQKSRPKSLVNNALIINRESEKSSDNSSSSKRRITKVKDKQAELEILKQNITKIYNLPDEFATTDIDENVSVAKIDYAATETGDDKNALRVEVESVSEINDIKVTESQTQDLMLIVQTSGDSRDVPSECERVENISTQMTIIVTPRISTPRDKSPDRVRKSTSPEQALTSNDVLDAIFHADAIDNISSVQLELEMSKDEIDTPAREGEDYPDDFSADVDNYNSRSDYGNNSPISLPKSSEEGNFWDT